MITQSCNVYGYFQNHCKGDDISKLYEKFHLTPLKCFIVTYYGVTSHPSAISTKKVLQKLMTDEILTTPALFVICLMLQLALVLQANALVFSQSYARNFFVYIVNLIIKNKRTSTALPPIKEIKKFKVPQIIQHSWKLLTPELYNSSQGLFYQTKKQRLIKKQTINKQLS